MKAFFLLLFVGVLGAIGYFGLTKFTARNTEFQIQQLQKETQASGQCFYDGQKYNRGNSFPSVDDCNTCFCQTDPNNPDVPYVVCTEMACASPEGILNIFN